MTEVTGFAGIDNRRVESDLRLDGASGLGLPLLRLLCLCVLVLIALVLYLGLLLGLELHSLSEITALLHGLDVRAEPSLEVAQ